MKGPKHGQIDAENMPHIGGNTWAGGSGGRDTAGLGGKGGEMKWIEEEEEEDFLYALCCTCCAGPYRSDSGHQVHQLTYEEKASVSAEVRAAAQEMAKVVGTWLASLAIPATNSDSPIHEEST